jgi:hypothetical protein
VTALGVASVVVKVGVTAQERAAASEVGWAKVMATELVSVTAMALVAASERASGPALEQA